MLREFKHLTRFARANCKHKMLANGSCMGDLQESGHRRCMNGTGMALEDRNEEGKQFTVTVEGNIASGKTTFLKHFRGLPQAQLIEEPVTRWRDVKGSNILALMYSDPKRWSLTFQTYVQLTMLDIHTTPQSAPVKLMERSIFSAKYCFVENLHNTKVMPDVEYTVLSEWFDWILKTQNVNVDLIVYLKTTPEICYERIRARNRTEEQEIPLSYLESLHKLHEDWLIKQTPFKLPAPVLSLDANTPLDEMSELINFHKDRILHGVSEKHVSSRKLSLAQTR